MEANQAVQAGQEAEAVPLGKHRGACNGLDFSFSSLHLQLGYN